MRRPWPVGFLPQKQKNKPTPWTSKKFLSLTFTKIKTMPFFLNPNYLLLTKLKHFGTKLKFYLLFLWYSELWSNVRYWVSTNVTKENPALNSWLRLWRWRQILCPESWCPCTNYQIVLCRNPADQNMKFRSIEKLNNFKIYSSTTVICFVFVMNIKYT